MHPAMVDESLAVCLRTFSALGVEFSAEQQDRLRQAIAGQTAIAWESSPRSEILVTYDSPVGLTVNYHVKPLWSTLDAAYDAWVATRQPPYFGTHPDARVWSLASEASAASDCPVLDIGAGTGRDAAYFAALGHSVVAVEPVDALRMGAQRLHPSPRIEWLADGLPELARLRGRLFDAVLLTAVWMHLDAPERARAMPVVAALVAPAGLLILSLRHGPGPPGRRMFDVPTEEPIAAAAREGLTCLVNTITASVQADKPGVRWTRLAFRKP